MRNGKHVKKIQISITDKWGIECDVEIDRCRNIRPCKTKTDQNRN